MTDAENRERFVAEMGEAVVSMIEGLQDGTFEGRSVTHHVIGRGGPFIVDVREVRP